MLKVTGENANPDSDPDPLVRGVDPRIRISTKMSWIRNTSNKQKNWKNLFFVSIQI